MDYLNRSVLKKLLALFLVFGGLMGAVFPFYANFFVEWKEGMLLWFVVGCLVAGLTIGIVNYALVNRILLAKVRVIADISNRISNGDLSHRIELESEDMVGEIVGSVNAMTDQLKGVMAKTSHTSQSLKEQAEQLQVLAINAERASGEQHQEVDQLLHAVNELVAIIDEVSKSTTVAAETTTSVGKECCDQLKEVDNAVTGIGQLVANVDQAKQVVARLVTESEAIGSVVTAINGVAEQTNLLALNAAIEAARAGDQGRGFAVVADEVRQLASRTQDSTQEIQAMTSRLQAAIDEIDGVMAGAVAQAQGGMETVESVAAGLREVRTKISTIDEMNCQIADAAQQQGNYANEYQQGVERIANLAGDSSRGAQELRQSSHEVTGMANQLHELMGNFRF